jgi:hypothetical protein
MRLTLLSLILLLGMTPCKAQRITLRHLMAFHSMDDSAISRELMKEGWRYKGVQYNMLRKPRMYAYKGKQLAGGTIPDGQLFLYNYHKKPLCKVELVCTDVNHFNSLIRDSLSYYGFQAEADSHLANEQKLKATASASFVNRDASEPIHALILYFEEKHSARVSLTIFAEQ